jgi:hypothetical protein
MDNFDELMFEALEDTLRMVLGENVSNLVHSFTERKAALKLKEAGKNIDDTIADLEKLLGKEGAQIIQTISIKRLFLKLKQEYEEVEAHFTVLDELYEMRFKLLAPLINEKNSEHN